MRVIHGIWADEALCLWAEDPALPRAHAPAPGAGRPSRAPVPHPFAAQAGELADLLAALPGSAGEAARKAVDDELTLHLPSAGGGPLASPELIRPDADPAGPGPRDRVSLARWRVPVVAFAGAAALDLLGSVGSLGDVAAVAGGSLPYLAALARFAEGLAFRGRVLPVLVAEDGGYAARWRPVLDGADAQRARDLAAAMPASCRAAGPEPPGLLLAAALDCLTDAAARTRLPAPLLSARRGRTPARLPWPERFVVALTTTDARLDVATPQDEEEAGALAAELEAWLDAARIPAGPVRTCFRLAEPSDPDGDHWRVEFALQSAEDPSLMVSAADLWAGEGATLLGSGLAAGRDPVEELLAGLGAGARLFGELEDALRDPAPAAVDLDTPGAFRFLKETGPLLAGAGFGVLLPDWARKARLGLKLTTRTQSPSGSSVTAPKFGLGDLVNFRYELAVGDQALDPDQLAELARLKVPLVRLRGQWVELDEAHLKAALRFLQRNPPGTMTAGEALAAGLRAPDDAAPLVDVDADGWLGDLLSGQADRRLAPVSAPAGFAGTLRPYQERGLSWLAFLGDLGLGGILADDMGLGKTIQLLSLVAAQPPGSAPTLLVCPMSLVGNWQREAARFTPNLRVHVHHGADRLDGDSLAALLARGDDPPRPPREGMTGADLVITSYGVATRDQAALSALTWARVVCDEAQNIKNHATKQSRAVRAVPAAARIALTGTPVENRLSDLWSIMEFTNPGLLGPAERFRETYAVPIERHGSEDAAAALKRVTQPFVLRRLKTDKTIISDLPDKQEMKVWCNLTAEQASLYAATVADMLSRIEEATDDISRRGLVLATMAKLKQVCNHPAHLLGDGSRLPGRSGKLARLEEICEEIVAEGDKALCFTQYAEFGRMLQPHLAARLDCPVLFLHGGTPKKQRDTMVETFASLDEPALFLLSLKAGGTGLNLTAASHVIHVDRWWNPAVEDQATDRAFRIGQHRNVQVRKFVCVGTLEERIDAMIEEKKQLAERIVGTGEAWLTELSVADLRSVLALSPDAVSA
ncbi:MAG TPA: SNF2-related protein [Streptosporangiaceae bacterium]|nr:SNF2-related protein [Streptosporangiaceae bacterium]